MSESKRADDSVRHRLIGIITWKGRKLSSINPSIARIDKLAHELNLQLKERGVNRRSFEFEEKIYDWSPDGDQYIRMKIYEKPYLSLNDVEYLNLDEMLELVEAWSQAQ